MRAASPVKSSMLRKSKNNKVRKIKINKGELLDEILAENLTPEQIRKNVAALL